MKNALVGMLLASVFIVPAQADNNHGSSGGSSGSGGSAAAPSASSTSTATGGAGGAGGTGTGGSATGGSATGGTATGGAATGGRSSANGNTSTVSVSLTNTGTGSGSSGSGNAAATDPNGVATVRYDGSYTVRSAPPIAAPSLTSTFSDTCMGSSSFGLSFVGFGATGGTTMVDDACVRRLDSREFRAMGLNDVALALLCQSPANKKAVEATGRACPTSAASSDTASAKSAAPVVAIVQPMPVEQQATLTVTPLAPIPAAEPQAPQLPQAVEAPQPPMDEVVAVKPDPVPEQARVEAAEMQPLSDEAGGK